MSLRLQSTEGSKSSPPTHFPFHEEGIGFAFGGSLKLSDSGQIPKF